MKKLAIVLLALLVAGSAFAERVKTDATPVLGGELTITQNRDDSFDFDFTGAGNAVALVMGPLSGSLSAAYGEFYMMMESTNYTYGGDLGMLFASENLSTIPYQIGGYNNYADTRLGIWPIDGQMEVGAMSGGLIEFAEVDVTGLYLFIGNLYGAGGENNWVGTI